MKRTILVIVLASLWFGSSFAQPRSGGFRSPGHRGDRISSFGLFPSIGFRSNVGIFPVTRIPREFAALYFADRFLFGGYEPTRAGRPFGLNLYDPRDSYYWGTGWYGYGYGSYGPTPALYDSREFVEKWKDRTPDKPEEPVTTESILLKQGMGEEEVIRAVGIPLQKVILGERTVWRYSSYSLLFEAGTLKEIR